MNQINKSLYGLMTLHELMTVGRTMLSPAWTPASVHSTGGGGSPAVAPEQAGREHGFSVDHGTSPAGTKMAGNMTPRSPQAYSYICVITSLVTPSNEHAGYGRVMMGFAVTIKQNKLLGLSRDPRHEQFLSPPRGSCSPGPHDTGWRMMAEHHSLPQPLATISLTSGR